MQKKNLKKKFIFGLRRFKFNHRRLINFFTNFELIFLCLIFRLVFLN